MVGNGFNVYAEIIDNQSNTPSLENLNKAVMSLSDSLYDTVTFNIMHKEYEIVVQVAKNPILTSADEAWCTYQDGKSDMLTWQNIRSQAVDYLKSTTKGVAQKNQNLSLLTSKLHIIKIEVVLTMYF